MSSVNSKLILGDSCYELDNIQRESIDLVVTSPPYDNLRTYGNSTSLWTFDMFKTIASKLVVCLKRGGVIVWVVNDAVTCGSETLTSFEQVIYFKNELGMTVHDTMIWEKDTMSYPDKSRYHQVFEYMFIISKGKPKTFNPICDRPNKYAGTVLHGTSRAVDGHLFRKSNDKTGTVSDMGVRYNVWKIPCEKCNTSNHPAVFPEQLAHDHVISWSNENDVVLDPFMGSGTVGVVCKKMCRNFIGIEKNEDYFKFAKHRIDSVRDKRLF